MPSKSSVKVVAIAFCGLVLGGAGTGFALVSQPPGPGGITAGAPEPQKFSCDSQKMKCECDGVTNCIDMKNSGQCKGKVTARGSVGTCTWAGPPPKSGTAMVQRPKPTIANSSGVKPYICDFKDKKVINCGCKDVSDCLKLDDSGMCGSDPIRDIGGGEGYCGKPDSG